MVVKDLAQIRDVIAAADQVFVETFKRGDAVGLAALYTKDAIVLPPNSDFVKGHAAIQGFWQFVVGGVKGAELDIVEVEECGDTAIEVGKFKMLDANGATLDYGKYIVVWKQELGQWKLHRDIFNSSKPAS